MKIENLKVGQVIKNYKELCEILEIKVCDGRTRKNQLDTFAEGVEYHKEGNKFVIDKIIKKVEIVDKRTLGNNNEQAKCLRYLLCNLLSSYRLEEGEVVGFSKYMLLKKLNMINQNYSIAKANRTDYANALEVSKIAIDECFDYLENSSISSIKRAIQTLRNQSALGYKYSFTWVDKYGYHHHCTTDEENTIHQAEQSVMKQMNVRQKSKIYEYGRWEEFKSKVVKKLQNEPFYMLMKDVKYYYQSFHFNYTNEGIQNHMRYMESKQGMTYEIALEGIQKTWNSSLDTTINNRYTKAVEGIEFGDYVEDKKNYRKEKKYISEQQKIKTTITDINQEEIKINKQIAFDDIENIDDMPF